MSPDDPLRFVHSTKFTFHSGSGAPGVSQSDSVSLYIYTSERATTSKTWCFKV